MTHLHERIESRVADWRADGYPCEDFPAINEILDWAKDPETGSLRFLRRPQPEALETYWHLRPIQETPHVFDLYKNEMIFTSTDIVTPDQMRSVTQFVQEHEA